MDSLANTFNATEHIMRGVSRRGTLTKEESTWVCNTCGFVEPYYVRLTGRWLRRPCACQLAEQKALEEAERRLAWQKEMIYQTYAWLGEPHWDLTPLSERTFDTFDRRIDKKAMRFDQGKRKDVPAPQWRQDAWEDVSYFADDPVGNLVIFGSYGTGKTHLLAALCNKLRTRHKKSRFVLAPHLFDAIYEYQQRRESYLPLIDKMTKAPLLVIDDVDKLKPNDFREDTYFKILYARDLAGLPTAISTNRLNELATYIGGGARSRLSKALTTVEMVGDDYRPEL